MMGGPAKGFLLFRVGPIGEFTEVASAKRAVRGVLIDNVEELEEVRGRIATCASIFSADGGT